MTTKDLGTLSADGDRVVLRFERRFARPPARVWRMVTEPEGLSRWFPARVAFDELAAGARMTFAFSAADLERAREHGVEGVPEVSAGVVVEVVPERVFAFEWLGEPIRIELAPDGEGCRLIFTHTFARDEAQAPRNAAGWHTCLEALAAALEDRAGPPADRTKELEEIYGRRFGSG